MATSLTAARRLTPYAAREYDAAREHDAGRRVDTEAGGPKLFASETAMEIALNAARIHGGHEIQRNVIAAQPVMRGGLDV